MRTNEELRGMPNLMILQTAADGGNGRMIFGKLDASVIWSTGAGWGPCKYIAVQAALHTNMGRYV